MAERGYATITISEVLDGYNQATVMLYARGASAPALPSSAVTYTFETGALSSVPVNWSRSVPTANGYPCWVIIAWPVGRDSTCSIATTDWSTATKLVEDGDDAYTVILTNESHTFVGDTTKAVAGSTTIGVQAFKGSTQVAATIGTITGQVTGLTTSISNNSSLTASVTVSVTTSLTTQGGTLTIPITVDAVTVNKVFSWTLKLNGKDGSRGASWFSGTGITGTSTTPTIFSGSGVSSALVGDHYLNSSTQNIYVCTTAGSASVAKWKYEENIKGATGKGITSITPYYYLSTSNTDQVGGSWTDTPPVYQVGRYYWTRQRIVWTDGSITDTDPPVLDNGLNAANSSAEYARLQAEPSLAMKINYSTYSTADSGEVYLHGYTNKAPADVNGYIMWNGVERTVTKGMINPNAIVPYNRYIYIVLRLTSASSTSGTLYMVWYNSGWKYAVTPTPTAVGGTWTWDEAKDVVLGQFIEPGSEQDLVEAYLYNPPRTPAQVKTTNVSPYQYSQAAVDWYNQTGGTINNALDMLAEWADGDFATTTVIDGGHIKTNTIEARHFMGDHIVSSNWDASDDTSSPFSETGTRLDLTTGNLYMPNFGIDNTNGAVYLNGRIYFMSGYIGNSGASNYWKVGTKVDNTQHQYAFLEGIGNVYVQAGDFQLTNGKLSSRSYNAQNQITYPYANSTYYDFGINMPTLDVTLDTETYRKGVDDIGHNDNFIYIRTAENSIPSFETNWNYVFRIDKNGMIWINGQSLDQKYASIDGVTGTYLPLTGGTVSGNLTVNGTLTAIASQATKLATSRTFIADLASTTAGSFDGQANVSLGITGILGVAHGGTGRNTLTSGSALIGNGTSAVNFRAITNNTSVTYITANDNLITANTLKFWKGSYDSSNNSNIEYVKLGKLGTAATHAVEDFITIGGGVIDGSLSVTDLTAGSLVVNGAARFVNGAIGDLTGNASTATTLATARTIQTNLASTSSASFNGSANITPGVTGTLGVGNGGTGQTSAKNAANAFMNALDTGSSTPVDADYYISQYVSGGTTTTTYHRRPMSALWAYVSGKISSVLGLTASTYGGKAATAGSADSATNATHATSADSATNATHATSADSATSATSATTATKVGTSLKIQLNSGTTEGTNQFTFNGQTAKTINITKSSVDLGNVDNNKQIRAVADNSRTTNHLVSWGANGYTVADSGYAISAIEKTVTSIASNNDGELVLTYLDGTQSEGIEVKIIGQEGSSVSYADALNVNGTAVGSASVPVFINAQGKPTTANTIPAVTLNGSANNTPNFYAPTGAGSNNQYLKSNGSGAPTWATFSKSTVGLGNVDNTSDANKPISTATQTALNNKAPKDAGVYVVKGTQTVDTGSWTGAIDLPALYDGLTIAYYLPRAGSGNATLNLTLSGGTTTGAIPVYVTSTTRMTTHYGAGSTILLTYWSAGSISVGGTATTENRWTHSDYWNSNTIGEYGGACTAGPNGMARYSLIMQVSENRWESLVLSSAVTTDKTKNTSGFLLTSPILYQSGGTYTNGNSAGYSSCWTTAQNIDTRYSFNCTNAWSATGRPLYLVGTISQGKFYLKNTQWWADALPTTVDGYYYWYVGQMTSAYGYTLHPEHPIYYYENGIKVYDPETSSTFGTPTVLVDTTTLTFAKDGDNAWYCTGENPISGFTSANIIPDRMYIVTWDGIEYNVFFEEHEYYNPSTNNTYECASFGNNTIIGFANSFITNAPFCVSYDFKRNSGEVQVFTLDTSTSHTIKIVAVPYTLTSQFPPYNNIPVKGKPIIRCGSGNYSTIESLGVDASGFASHAEGNSYAGGYCSHGEGLNTVASGDASHVEGRTSIASGTNSHAEGLRTEASGQTSHAEGQRTQATGSRAHSEGSGCIASGVISHSEGQSTVASGNMSHSEGDYTIANHRTQHVFGAYNIADPSTEAANVRGNYVEIVGNGTAENARSNARTLDWNGNEVLAGSITATSGTFSGAISGTAISGTTGTFTGAISCTSLSASSFITVNSSNSSTAGGIALYSTSPTSYGVAMRGTSNGGKHGYVQGDWAIYSYMSGSDSTNKYTRGWIFKNASDNVGVASISGAGNAAFSGSVTIGANTNNTSGCRLVMDNTLKCLNFVFA